MPETSWTYERLTADGRSAVAVWRLDGINAAVRQVLAKAGIPSMIAPSRPRLIALGDEPAEDCVCLDLGDESLEIQTHGGQAVAERVERIFIECGGKAASSADFETDCQRLIQRATTRRVAVWLASVAPRLRDRFDSLRAATPNDIANGLQSAIANYEAVERLLTGYRVAIVGLPNAGKSSLLNRLVGFERSLIDPRPGATRDAVEVPTAINGFPALLIDTAGLRQSADVIEQEGVRRSKLAGARADVVVVVIDRSEPAIDEVRSLLEGFPAAVIVAHKSDQPDASGLNWPSDSLHVSSQHSDGVEALLNAIDARVAPSRPASDALFLPSPRCCAIAASIIHAIETDEFTEVRWNELLR